MAIIGLKRKRVSRTSVFILLIITVLIGIVGLSSKGRYLIKSGYYKVAQPLLIEIRGVFTASQKEAIEQIRSQPSTVGVPALAEGYVSEDAMNAAREAQRVASVALNDTIYQVMGYVSDPDRMVVLAVRNDQASDVWTGWQTYKYDGSNGLPDLGSTAQDIHNWVSVGIDPQGYVHVTWDMHNDPLKYRRVV